MRLLILGIGCILVSWIALAQGDRGTITGTVSDPAGAVVAAAPVEIRNVETGSLYRTVSSATGNYTLAQLPAGQYELTVTMAGFKRYVRQGVTVGVAQTYRIDAALEVGSNAESVTVTEAAPLLKTESGELSHTVASERLNNLPVLGIGASAGTSGLRNPYAVLQVLPGSDYRPDSSIRVNGLPANTQSLRIEGQDSTDGISATASTVQPSVDAVQEFAIQTSNYSAEFGQAGGGVFNVTMKSGNNQLHGTAYEYWVNEALNAGQPFTNDGNGHLRRNRVRRNDYGFTLGGPVYIPKVYKGRDKSFFFFNFEQFRETIVNTTSSFTVPIAAYRNGDMRQVLTGRTLCAAPCSSDPLGRAILENAIYDPGTDRLVNGQRARDVFPNNTIPLARFDPVAAKIQALLPQPDSPGLINNFHPAFGNPRLSFILSVKIDHNLGSKSKISGYWSRTRTGTPNVTGLPDTITTGVPSLIVSNTVRLNFDQALTPALLAHVGAGLVHTLSGQTSPAYDPVKELGLRGTYANLFPVIQSISGNQGGGPNMGPGSQTNLVNTKPTANASVTWVKNNHTFKIGAEVRYEGFLARSLTYSNVYFAFSPNYTGLPSTNGANLQGGSIGYGYASFLLGGVNNGFIAAPSDTRVGNSATALFAQDSWKVTRKLTLDYGLRYDFSTYPKEQYGRFPVFAPGIPNPGAGNRLGAIAFEGNGPGQCDCALAHNYPFAFGPRIGVAYQITSKTVLRAGFGISYGQTGHNNALSTGTGILQTYSTPSFGDPAFLLSNGVPYKVSWPNFDPGQIPFPGTVSSPQFQWDQNAGRPSRTLQWSVGLQRQIARDLVVEAAFVGNRGAWWNTNWLINPNAQHTETLTQLGLDIHKQADRDLLRARLDSSLAATRGFAGLPYNSFPTSLTVAQALRPYPQFSTLANFKFSPVGDTWYDSLQLKATKRLSHGLDVASSFTWSKALSIGVEQDSNLAGVVPVTNDIFNRSQNKYLSGYDQPYLFVLAGTYALPKLGGNKVLSWAARDWQLGAVLRYGSGFPIPVPIATTNINTLIFRENGNIGQGGGTPMNPVAGQPLFTQDLNCHCFDPNKTFVLNPKAWVNPADGDFGTSAGYYGGYRYQRKPVESMSLARIFVFGPEGKMNVQIRGEFTNIFNRTQTPNPTASNALATQLSTATGQTTSGFGYINTAATSGSRQGTLVARFTF
jgi:hypothetical protein